MKKEIVDFYADKGLHISKIINRRPYDVSPEQIEAAAELVYYDIQNGHELKNIQIASEVFRVAKDINGEKYAQEKALLDNYQKSMSILKKKLKILNIDKDMIEKKYLDEKTLLQNAEKTISELTEKLEDFKQAKDINEKKYAQEKILVENAKQIISELTIESKEKSETVKKIFALLQEKDAIRKNRERTNRRLKIYLIITLTALLISEFILILPYIKILLRGF